MFRKIKEIMNHSRIKNQGLPTHPINSPPHDRPWGWYHPIPETKILYW